RKPRISVRREAHDLSGLGRFAKYLLRRCRKHSTKAAERRHFRVVHYEPCTTLDDVFLDRHDVRSRGVVKRDRFPAIAISAVEELAFGDSEIADRRPGAVDDENRRFGEAGRREHTYSVPVVMWDGNRWRAMQYYVQKRIEANVVNRIVRAALNAEDHEVQFVRRYARIVQAIRAGL